MIYKLKYKVSFDDYLKLQKQAMASNHRKVMIIFNVLILAIFSYEFHLFDWQNSSNWAFSLAFMVIIILAINLALPLVEKKRLKKLYDSNQLYQFYFEVTLSETEIQINSELSQQKLTPELIRKVSYFSDTIYLFISKNTMYILPRRDWDDKSWAEFTDFIKKYWDKSEII